MPRYGRDFDGRGMGGGRDAGRDDWGRSVSPGEQARYGLDYIGGYAPAHGNNPV